MHRTTRLDVTDINQHFVCVICDGYIIDATTIVECLHSFCRTCIVRFLETSKFCPVCDVQVHKTKPLQSIRSDTTLQDVIYKLIPGLYQNEMHRRREFYADHPEAAAKCSTEERGEGAEQRCFYSPKENISLTLEYFKGVDNQAESESTSDSPDKDVMTRYLNCPAAMTVAHLKKFIRMKFSLPLTYMIKVMYSEHLLSDDYTLMDIAYIYSWRRAGPMKFFYTFAHRKHVAQRPTFPAIEEATTNIELSKQESSKTADASVPADDKIAQLPPDEPEKMDTEETTQSPATVTNELMQTSETPESTSSPSSTMDPVKMEVVDTDIPTPTTTQSVIPSPSEAAAPSAELSSKVLPKSSGIKLKLFQLLEPSKPTKTRKNGGGRKANRIRNIKAAPVPQRFPRLAPYPPPHQTTMASASQHHLATMRKYNVPTVMTSIAPNLMLSFVPTTANSLCSMNSTSKPAILPAVQTTIVPTIVNGQDKVPDTPTLVPVCVGQDTKPASEVASIEVQVQSNGTVATEALAPRPAFYPPPQQTVAVTCVTPSPLGHLPITKNSQAPSSLGHLTVTNNTSKSAANKSLARISKTPSPLGHLSITNNSTKTTTHKTVVSQAPSPLGNMPMTKNTSKTVVSSSQAPPLLGHQAMANKSQAAPFGVTSSLMAALVSTTSNSTLKTVSPMSKMADMVNGASETMAAIKGPEPSMPTILPTTKGLELPVPSLLHAALCDDKFGKKSPKTASVAPPEYKVECNGGRKTPNKDNVVNKDTFTPASNKEFQFSPEKKSAFELSVKNSISAEFSDNDDLGCQPDLVVDEQKMEEDDDEDSHSDNEEDALRKKIAAIAEEKEDEDSGRASDISSQARSSCDDDVGSPSVPTTVISETTTTASSCLPSFSLATSSSSNRTSKSNNINHVINNLLLRNHERKDSMGALDLSTCTKTPGPSRPKPVANPVLDIKHRQQTYLPAPNNSNNANNNANNSSSSKQHTACVPSPKHPILMHGLTSQGLTPLQISAMQGKSPHLPVTPFHGTAMVYTSQSSRTIPSPTCVPSGRSPTYNTSPGVHQAALLSGMIPRMGAPTASMSSYPSPTTSTTRNYNPIKGISISPNHNLKGMSSSPSNSASNHMKASPNKGVSPTNNSNHHPKYMNSNNHLKGMSPSSSPNSNQPSRTFSAAANHLKGLASPPQNPYSKGSHGNKSSPPVPSYKKSGASNFPAYSGGKKPPAAPSYKSYNHRFKTSGNLTVINPDPNGSLHKLVIRNLDARPTSPQSQKL